MKKKIKSEVAILTRSSGGVRIHASGGGVVEGWWCVDMNVC